MNIEELTQDFHVQAKRIAPLNYITLNGRTLVLNDDEIESLEYGLTNLLHAISVYQRARTE